MSDLFTQFANVGTKIWGGFDLKEANACVAVSKTSVPVLIIHGDKDKQAPVSMAYKIYDSCKSERELYIVSGSEHTDCYRSNPEKYESIVSEFLKNIFRLIDARSFYNFLRFKEGRNIPTIRHLL